MDWFRKHWSMLAGFAAAVAATTTLQAQVEELEDKQAQAGALLEKAREELGELEKAKAAEDAARVEREKALLRLMESIDIKLEKLGEQAQRQDTNIDRLCQRVGASCKE